jgi:hypothetical protein
MITSDYQSKKEAICCNQIGWHSNILVDDAVSTENLIHKIVIQASKNPPDDA